MITVCLSILHFVGQWCGTGEQNVLIGDCHELGRYEYICTVDEPEKLPAYLSAYDTAWCEKYPTNGYDGCTHFANGIEVGPEWYGVAVACPFDLIPKSVSIPGSGLGVMRCVDTGGAIVPTYRDAWFVSADGIREYRYGWVMMFDVYYEFTCDPGLAECWPWFALQAHEEWEIIYYE